MKRERDPTAEEYEKFLRWIDPDRDTAGEKLLQLQNRLSRIFTVRGCHDPEELVKEVINRVAVRSDEVIAKYDSPAKCLQGFADNVYLEWRRDVKPDPLDEKQIRTLAPDVDDQEELELEDECLSTCMGELVRDDADLFRRYFQEVDSRKIRIRKKLAEELGLTLNALRIKAHRIRKRLRDCMEQCLEQFPPGEMKHA